MILTEYLAINGNNGPQLDSLLRKIEIEVITPLGCQLHPCRSLL
jgi:hypothetical protein